MMLIPSISSSQIMQGGKLQSIYDLGMKLSGKQKKQIISHLHQAGMIDIKGLEFYDYNKGEIAKHLFLHYADETEKRYFELSDADIQTLFQAIVQCSKTEPNHFICLLESIKAFCVVTISFLSAMILTAKKWFRQA